jgi:aminomuconate-semialdehyde/2-hydroxymuconate-6-semialdehyde dehydrogenase
MKHDNNKIANFINGEMLPACSGAYIENIEPATSEPYALIPDSDEKDLELALNAANDAYKEWKNTAPEYRANILIKLSELIEKNKNAFIEAETIDNGKPVSLSSTIDIPRSIANLREFADAAVKLKGDHFEKNDSKTYTLRQPMGVVATISPWNFPLMLFTWKFAPALAAGNCVIAKPSEITPMSAYMLSKLANDAGFPPGVFNVLHGRGAQIGNALTKSDQIEAVSFTGGTLTGKTIYKNAAENLKKVSLELGGKNPVIIFSDADFESALEGAKKAAFANQGQVCLCGSRLFVQKDIYEKFCSGFVEKTRKIVIGDPLEKNTEHGATVSLDHMNKILSYIELAKKEGGEILCGGKRHKIEGRCQNGYFIEPTIISNLTYDCKTNQEEIFGPVVSIMPFEDEEDAIKMANATQYGLSASVWTQNKEKAAYMAKEIESGIVWLNSWNLRDLEAPFGGVKNSGIGREGKWRAMEFFTQEKTVTQPK